uniref:Adhesion G protein-coupled receptor F3b n=1 Tax=Sinocyclocheilus rhinocerous TaxID=307959 RepID=A0A673LF16_9TELE
MWKCLIFISLQDFEKGLGVCRSGSTCNRTVFNVDVELNATADMVKTVGLQSLANRLPKLGYEDASFPSIVVSSTVENNTQPSVNIKLAFPNEQGSSAKMTCVFWNVTEERWSDDGCEFVKGPGNLASCECNHLTSFSMLMSKHSVSMPFLDQLTYVGLGVSICSLIVYIIIECLVWSAVVKSSLSHFRHTALLNISLCLLLADCSFLASSFPSILNETMCLVLVVARHYFFLAMFFWMLCLSVMLVHQLIFVFSHTGKKMYMILGFTIGYVCPTVTVAVTYVYYDQASDIPYYSSKTCWLTYQSAMQGSIHAFLFPVGTIILVNMFSMMVVIATVLKPSGAESNKKGDKDAAKSIMTVTVAVTYVYYDQASDIPYYSSKTCWLTYQSAMQGSIHAFLFPVGTIVLVNVFSMVVVIATVLKPSGAESNKKGDKDAAKSIIKVILFLTPIFLPINPK